MPVYPAKPVACEMLHIFVKLSMPNRFHDVCIRTYMVV